MSGPTSPWTEVGFVEGVEATRDGEPGGDRDGDGEGRELADAIGQGGGLGPLAHDVRLTVDALQLVQPLDVRV